ncbi:MAG: methyltransferase [Hyphomonas sp.]|nr:methyltransferase [Hyphomonas sp.]
MPDKPASADVYRVVEETLQELYPMALIGEDEKSFWREQALLDLYTRLCGSNRRSFERKFAVINLLKLTHKLPGDIAECGTYEGATAFMIADELRRARVDRKIHLFDSFEGLSKPGEKDGKFWSAGGLSADESKARLNLAGFSNAAFYRGWIPERFPEVGDRSFALVHIDVDLYQPTLDSLAFFYPRMVKGGLIICDDYGFTTCPGAREAMDSFFGHMPELVVHLPTGQGLVLKE